MVRLCICCKKLYELWLCPCVSFALIFCCANSKRPKRPQISCLLCTCFMENPLKWCSIWCAGCFCGIVSTSIISFGSLLTEGYYHTGWQGKRLKQTPYTSSTYFSTAEGILPAVIPGSAWTLCIPGSVYWCPAYHELTVALSALSFWM